MRAQLLAVTETPTASAFSADRGSRVSPSSLPALAWLAATARVIRVTLWQVPNCHTRSLAESAPPRLGPGRCSGSWKASPPEAHQPHPRPSQSIQGPSGTLEDDSGT